MMILFAKKVTWVGDEVGFDFFNANFPSGLVK